MFKIFVPCCSSCAECGFQLLNQVHTKPAVYVIYECKHTCARLAPFPKLYKWNHHLHSNKLSEYFESIFLY